MADLFRGARLKIKRANKHIADLDVAILRLKDNYTSTVEINTQTGHQDLVHTCPEFAQAIEEMSLIAGDAIHNLRTALDFAWVSTLRNVHPDG
jgi:hypothetical protein